MRRLSLILVSAVIFGQPAAAPAQTSRVMVDQIGIRRAVPPRANPRVTQGDTLSSGTPSTGSALPQTEALTSDLLAACQAGVAPPGVRCPRSGGYGTAGTPPATAEGTLLQIFGVPQSFTTAGGAPLEPMTNADAVARELGTEGSQGQVSDEAAGAVQWQRSSPPPNSPR